MSVVKIITKFHVNRFSVVGAFLSSYSYFISFVRFSVCLDSEFQSNGWYNNFKIVIYTLWATHYKSFLLFLAHLFTCSLFVDHYFCVHKEGQYACMQSDWSRILCLCVWKLCKWKTETINKIIIINENGSENIKKKRMQICAICILQCITVFRSIVIQSIDRWLIHHKLIMNNDNQMTTFMCAPF